MAAVFRSLLGKTFRRALSLEGNLSLHPSQQHRRLLHAGRIAQLAGASCAKPFRKSPKVDPLVKKIDDVARKAAVVEYTQSLVQEEKTKPGLMAVCCAGLFTAGYHVGFYGTTEE